MRFGAGTEVFGKIHSNVGIRFDGVAHNVISSGVASFDDPDHGGGNEFGVHTHDARPIPYHHQQYRRERTSLRRGESFRQQQSISMVCSAILAS
jgi:hypothetical protein